MTPRKLKLKQDTIGTKLYFWPQNGFNFLSEYYLEGILYIHFLNRPNLFNFSILYVTYKEKKISPFIRTNFKICWLYNDRFAQKILQVKENVLHKIFFENFCRSKTVWRRAVFRLFSSKSLSTYICKCTVCVRDMYVYICTVSYKHTHCKKQ